MSGRRARSAPERAKVVYRGSYDIFIVGCRRDERTDASAFIFVHLRFQILPSIGIVQPQSLQPRPLIIPAGAFLHVQEQVHGALQQLA